MNKNGWGLRTELLFILMFLMCLVVATIGLNKIGLIGNPNTDIKVIPTDINTEDTYFNMETKLSNAAKNYINSYYGGEYVENSLTIRHSSLYYNGYMNKLVDNNGKSCSGYVIVEKIDSTLVYRPYLKCPGYKTSGYSSSKDW